MLICPLRVDRTLPTDKVEFFAGHVGIIDGSFELSLFIATTTTLPAYLFPVFQDSADPPNGSFPPCRTLREGNREAIFQLTTFPLMHDNAAFGTLDKL